MNNCERCDKLGFDKCHCAKPKYQVGYLFDTKITDPEFMTLDEANTEAHAREVYGTVGIWTSQSEGGELLFILHNGEVFSK